MQQQVTTFPAFHLEGVTIPDTQVTVHKTFEALAVFAVAPFMVYLATRKELPAWARVTSAVVAAGTWIVDGGLLWQYVKG